MIFGNKGKGGAGGKGGDANTPGEPGQDGFGPNGEPGGGGKGGRASPPREEKEVDRVYPGLGGPLPTENKIGNIVPPRAYLGDTVFYTDDEGYRHAAIVARVDEYVASNDVRYTVAVFVARGFVALGSQDTARVAVETKIEVEMSATPEIGKISPKVRP